MIRMTVKDGSILQTLTVDEEKVFVGRMDSNTITLDDPSVSRKHCLIRQGQDGLEVLDLNSRHGTRRNGESIERSPLAVGDKLDIGEVWIRIEALEGLPTGVPSSVPVPRRRAEEESAKPKETAPARESKDLLSDTRRTSFSESLYVTMRRTPWWAGSLFVHVLAIYVFFSVPFGPVLAASPFGTLNGTLDDDFASLLEDELDLNDDLSPPELDELEEMPVPDEPEPMPSKLPDPEPEEEVELPNIGPLPNEFDVALQAPGGGGGALLPDSAFGKDGAEGMNRRASDYLRNSMGGRGGMSGLLKRLSKDDLLVARGHYDKCEETLHLLKLPHDNVPMTRLDRTDLEGRKVLIVNCSNETLAKKTIERIRQFVKDGGYLLTTDWAVANVLEPAFPEYLRPLRRNGRKVITPDEVISIRGARGVKRNVIMKGTPIADGTAKWWLEESSFPFEVLKKNAVDVLIESDDLKERYGVSSVAVTFRFGKGRVLHMLGHIYQMEGNLKGAFSTQRMMANFLIAAIRKQ